MEESNSNKKHSSTKRPRKRKSHWVYVKIGTRIVDVKKVFISADEDWNHIKESSKVVAHTDEKRNKEMWNWASGGKSISGQKVTKNTTQTLTKFVYKNEPKVVEPRGRTTKKVKSTLQPTLPKIVRSSPTPSPPGRASISSTKNSPAHRKSSLKRESPTPQKDNSKFPGRNPNSIKLNPIRESSLQTNKSKRSQKSGKANCKKSERLLSLKNELSTVSDSKSVGKSINDGSNENKEILDEGFASDYSGAGNGSYQDNTSGESSPLNEESRFSEFAPDETKKERTVRSNSVPHDGRSIQKKFQSSSHIIRLTNSFKIEAENTNNSKIGNGEVNERGKLFTLEMTEVVNVNLQNEQDIIKDGEDETHFSYDIDSLIASEAKKLREMNIVSALDEIRSEEQISIILQG